MSPRSRRRCRACAILIGAATWAACEFAHAEPAGPNAPTNGDANSALPPVPRAQPYYTLEVDSDETDEISYEALAARIQSELGATVARASMATATRAAIVINWRSRSKTLTVRATHVGGQILERTVETNGDAAATQREAVLLAGNLARDEARELLDELAARAPKPIPPSTKEEPKTEKKEESQKDEAEEEHADETTIGSMPVTAGLFFPIATNFEYPNVKSWVDLSVVYGRVGRVSAAQIGIGLVYASKRVTGLQLAPIATVSDGRVTGTQISAGAAIANGKMQGVQIAAGANVVVDRMNGLQMAAGANVVKGDVKGVQATSGANIAVGSVRGAQLAVGANVATGEVYGLQVGVAANVTPKPLIGWQFAAGVNYAQKVTGLQATAAVNYAGDVTGAQFSSVNIGADLTGAQIGIVNVGRKVKGAQFGVVNVAEEVDGVQFGVVNVTRTGVHPTIWLDSLNYFNVGFRFATKYMYTVAAFSLGSRETGFNAQGATLALGTNLPLYRGFNVDVETAFSSITIDVENRPKDVNQSVHVRLLPGYSFSPRFRVFAGGGVRIPVDFSDGSPVTRPEFMAGVHF